MQKIKLAVVDDQNLFRQSLCALIRTVPEFELLHESGNGQFLLDSLGGFGTLPDIALIDLDMPVMNGIELTEKLQSHYPGIKIIILSVHTDERLIARLVEDGVHAFLAKNCDKEDLIEAIHNVYAFGFHMDPETFQAVQNSYPKNKFLKTPVDLSVVLTRREKEVLSLICKELNNVEIAKILFVSARTIEWHRNNLLLKTGSKNTAGLVLFSLKHGLHFT